MTSNWKKRAAGMLACLFIMQSLPVSALAAELTEEETQEVANLIPAESQDAVNLADPTNTGTTQDKALGEDPDQAEDEKLEDDSTSETDEPEQKMPEVQQPQQETSADMIVPAVELMSDGQEDVAVELQDGTAVIPSDATETEVKEALYEALVANKDELGEDFDPQSLEWEYYCEGKSKTGLTKNSAWGSIEGFTSTTKKLGITTTYTHPALAENNDDSYQIRLAGTTDEATLTKAAKLDSSIELNGGDYTVGLTYSDSTTVNYDALRKAIFDAVVASTTPKLTYSEVSIQYEATATTGIVKEWMPLEGGKDILTYPAISVGEHKIKISWGGNDSYHGTSVEVGVTITERTTPSITLGSIGTINMAGKDWSAVHEEILKAATIDNEIELTTDNTKVQYLKNKLIGDDEWTEVNASNFGELQEQSVQIRVIYEGSAEYTSCTSNEVEVRFAMKSDSSIVVNENQSVALPYTDASTVDYNALRERIFKQVVASVEPDLNINDVTIEYYAENIVLGRPGGTYAWMPLEGGKSDVREFPPISEGTHQIKISWEGNDTYYGFEKEVTVNITEREQAPYTLKATPDSVMLAVDENLAVDYEALHDAIFNAVVESSDVLKPENVSIEYYYEGLTELDSKWLPLEGESLVGDLGYPAISAGERQIRIVYAGDQTYAPTTITATITVADREQVQFNLKDGPYEVGMVYDAEQGYDYTATAKAIYDAVVASTTPAVNFEDVTLEFSTVGGIYKPLDQTNFFTNFGVGNWKIKISVADTQAYRGNSVAVDVTTVDNRISSAVVLKNGVSFTYNMDPVVMEQAIFENVIDWDSSTLPSKDTLSLDDFEIEYKAKLTDIESGIDLDLGDIPGLNSDLLDQWVPIEGKEYKESITGIVLGAFPQMGAGENQQIRIRYKGNVDYKPSETIEGTVTVNKAKVSVTVNSTNIYADEALPADFITTNPADELDIYTIYAGVTSNVTTGIYLDLPERYNASAFLKVLDPVVKAVYGKSFTQLMNDGITVGELRELFSTQELLDLLDKLDIDTGTFGEILTVVNKLPSIMDNVRISFGEPNRAGLYTVAAVTDNKNYETGVGMGFLLVKMRMSGTHLTWNEEMDGGKLTAEQAKSFDFGATLSYNGDITVDQSGVHYLYSGFTSKWRIYSSTTTPPTEPGRYVVTVCILGGNYMAAPITRSFQITK